MRRMIPHFFSLKVWILGMLLLATGCAPLGLPRPLETQSRPPAPAWIPTQTRQPPGTPRRPTLAAPTLEPPSSPTSTPVLYTIRKEDTLLGIALKYNLSLDDLLAANPGIDPDFLTIGSTLTLPIASGTAILPSLPPQTVTLSAPLCAPDAVGGQWCLLMAHNVSGGFVESVSARVALFDSTGQFLTAEIADAPLNRVPPDGMLPLGVYFDAPQPQVVFARADLLTALAAPAIDARYLTVTVQTTATLTGTLQARVRGEFQLDVGASAPGTIWLLAAGFDAGGRVVALRRLDWNTPIPPLRFDMNLFSLADEIVRVQVWAEARP